MNQIQIVIRKKDDNFSKEKFEKQLEIFDAYNISYDVGDFIIFKCLQTNSLVDDLKTLINQNSFIKSIMTIISMNDKQYYVHIDSKKEKIIEKVNNKKLKFDYAFDNFLNEQLKTKWESILEKHNMFSMDTLINKLKNEFLIDVNNESHFYNLILFEHYLYKEDSHAKYFEIKGSIILNVYEPNIEVENKDDLIKKKDLKNAIIQKNPELFNTIFNNKVANKLVLTFVNNYHNSTFYEYFDLNDYRFHGLNDLWLDFLKTSHKEINQQLLKNKQHNGFFEFLNKNFGVSEKTLNQYFTPLNNKVRD